VRGCSAVHASLYKICIYVKACEHERIILFCPSPSALPILLQYTIARRLRNLRHPHPPPFCMPYSIHNWCWHYPVKAKVHGAHAFRLRLLACCSVPAEAPGGTARGVASHASVLPAALAGDFAFPAKDAGSASHPVSFH